MRNWWYTGYEKVTGHSVVENSKTLANGTRMDRSHPTSEDPTALPRKLEGLSEFLS